MPVHDAIPFFRYADAPAAVAFLKAAFGFEEILVVPDGQGGLATAQLRLGDGLVMLASLRDADPLGWEAPKQPRQGYQGVYWIVDDPDAHHARALAAGADVLMPPTTQDYGGRDYTVRDPEGHLWSFGTYRPEA